MSNRLEKIVKGFSAAAIGLLLINLIGLIFQPLIARILGPAEYGYFGVFVSFFTILSYTFILGVDEGSKKFLNRYSEQKLGISLTALFIVVCSGLISAAIGLILFLMSQYSILFENNMTIMLLIAALIAILPLNLFNLSTAFLYSDFKEYIAEILHVLSRLIFLGGSTMLVYLGYSFWIIPFTLFFSYLLTSLIGLSSYYFYKSNILSLSFKSINLPNHFFNLLKFGGTIVLINFFFNLHLHFDVVVVNWLLNAENAGIYKAMIVIAHFLWLVPAASSKILLHNFSELVSESREYEIVNLTNKVFYYSILISCLLGVGIISLAEPFISLYYGQQFVEGVIVLKVLAVGAVIGFSAMILSPALEALDKEFYSAKATLFSALTNIILTLVLIPLLGIVGAAIATSVSYTSMLIFYMYYYRLETQSTALNFRQIAKMLLNTIFVYFVMYICKLFLVSQFYKLLILPIIGLFAFVVGALLLQLIEPNELKYLRNLLKYPE